MSTAPFPIFTVLSLILPVAGAACAAERYTKTKADSVGGAIGILIGAYLIFACACLLGEIMAGTALFRGERPRWLSITGAVLNLSAVIPPLYFFLSKK